MNLTTTSTYSMQMVINGLPCDASDGGILEVINPATNELIATVPESTLEDVNNAVAAAKIAQKTWAKIPVYQKVAILERFLSLVEENKEELAQTLCAETGKPIVEARAEIGNIPIGFRSFCEKAKHLYGTVMPAGLEPGQDSSLFFTQREPIGVVGCIIPFNFPCDLYDQKVAPALLSGNAAIVKPPEDNPLTLCKLTHLMMEAGVTPGALQILTGRGERVGSYLVNHPDVHLITFTGSTKVGILTAQACAKKLAHVALELGGNDAFIVLEDADLDLATDEVIWGRMYNTGQVCCASKRFLVQHTVVEEFTKKVIDKINAIPKGMPSDEEARLGCLISTEAAIGVEEKVNLTILQGGELLLGGTRDGAFYSPTVIGNVPKTADVATNLEIFGPVVPIIPFETVEEAIEIANSSMFGLCGCVFTNNMKTAFHVVNALECGGTVINGASFYRSFEMPFGGYKFSGIGTEGVMSTFNEMTRTKSIVLKNIL